MKKLISLMFILSLILSSCSEFVPFGGTVLDDASVPVVKRCDVANAIPCEEPPASDTLYTNDTAEDKSAGTSDEAVADEQTVSELIETEEIPATPPKGIVYMTFDDGPSKNTERVLEILDKYGIKATFFVVGTNIKKYPDATRDIYSEGHLIGCHSVTHNYNDIYKTSDAIREDISAWETIVSDVLATVPTEHLYRFPGGSTCSAIKKGVFEELHAAVLDMGYRSFDWTFGNNDRWDGDRKEGQSVEDYLKQSVKVSLKLGGKPHILLLHETAGATVDTLEWTIEYLLSEGYVFDTLDNLESEYLFRR